MVDNRNYWARLFGSQIERGGNYRSLRPAVIVVFLDYEELEGDRLHSTFQVIEKTDHVLFSEMLELHLIELPKLGQMEPKELEQSAALVKWARFLAAETDDDLAAAAEGDESMEKAKSYLDMLSAKPDVRKLAEIRELAYRTYQIEINAAKDEGHAEGKVALLTKLVEQRFGKLTSDQLAQLEALDPDSISDRLFTAESLAELLDS